MKLPLQIAQKLQALTLPNELIAGSSMQHPTVVKMVEDGILYKRQVSKTKSQIYLPDSAKLKHYLHNHFGIPDLDLYVISLSAETISRAVATQISGDSKIKSIRTFSGFLANVYEPVSCQMHGRPFTLQPLPGSFTFIQDYEHFLPDSSITIVGIENAENFNQIKGQAYLFKHIKPLFVSRYPQSNDLVKWLQLIPNPYLHFGDLDFEGINIYLHEFKKHLGNKASFFIPPQTAAYLPEFGNRMLYNKQLFKAPTAISLPEQALQNLMILFHKHKKVLEQEIFINEIF
jgi:hypothetical protein